MKGRKSGERRERMKAPGRRMNEARTNEMRSPSGCRKSPFSGLALPRVIKVKFKSADNISRFSTFCVSARPRTLFHFAESSKSPVIKHSARILKQTRQFAKSTEAKLISRSSHIFIPHAVRFISAYL